MTNNLGYLYGRVKDFAELEFTESVQSPSVKVPTKRLDGFYGGGRHQGVVARVEVMARGVEGGERRC